MDSKEKTLLEYQEMEKKLKEREKALLEQSILLKGIIDSIPDVLAIQKPDHTIEFYNKAGYAMLQKTPEETTGKKCYEIIGKQNPCEVCATNAAILSKKTISLEKYIKEMDIYLHCTSAPVFDENGNILHMVEQLRDITALKIAEKKLRKAKDEAEQASLLKSQFLANMSHEIRTPMNGIMGFLELLENTYLNEEQKEYIQNIQISSETLLTVINDILDISKIESGNFEIEEILFDIRSSVEASVIPFMARASEKEVELNMLIRSNIPEMAIGDSTRIRQVLTNLISNAVKFTKKGDVFIEVALEKENDTMVELIFKVQDTGIGIKEDTIKNLFKAFIQADASTTREYGGTGLGLAICKNIIEMMGGKIWATSEFGKGSTFFFRIPMKKSNYTSSPINASYRDLKGKNIFIVDDNRMNREIARIYLQEMGCMVQEEEDAAVALKKIISNQNSANKIDIILIDYQMPEMSGYDLAAALKAILHTQNIPMILLTSVALKGDAKKAKERGFTAFLTKPYRRKELLDCVSFIVSEPDLNNGNGEKHPLVTRHSIRERKISNRLKILLVEDNKINQKFFMKLLQNKELTCEIAENGVEAVNACMEKYYDLVFMDCQMPIMDGYEATKEIRRLEEENNKKRTLIIAMTAYSMKGDQEKCIQAGMDDYLGKPVKMQEVMGMIKKYYGDEYFVGESYSEKI